MLDIFFESMEIVGKFILYSAAAIGMVIFAPVWIPVFVFRKIFK
jgi:hypothetical protein